MSLPSRERGLKLEYLHKRAAQRGVAPFAGAWIEIAVKDGTQNMAR